MKNKTTWIVLLVLAGIGFWYWKKKKDAVIGPQEG